MPYPTPIDWSPFSFRRKQEGVGNFAKPPPNVQAVVDRIRRATELHINKFGGTAFSVIRNAFVRYDYNATGYLGCVWRDPTRTMVPPHRFWRSMLTR